MSKDYFEEIEEPINAFITAVAETVLELDDIMQQPDPKETFVGHMENHIEGIETDEGLSREQRDLLRTFHSAFRGSVLQP